MSKEGKEKKPIWKKWWFWLGIVIVIIIAANSGGKGSNSQTVSNPDSGGQTSTATTKTNAEKLTITNSSAKSQYGTWQVVGEVKNNDSIKHTATLKATFYDKGGKILGTAVGAVNDLASGETKTFTLMGTDEVTGYDNFKVQVDTLM